LPSRPSEALAGSSVPAADPRPRRGEARQRLLEAAAELFCRHGYLPVTVEEIAVAAGVSRVTFYRQFAGKEALTAELFRAMTDRVQPRYARIARLDYRDPVAVRAWIADIFAADRAYPGLLRAFTEALVVSPGFLAKAQQFTNRLIAALGEAIPAFAASPDRTGERRQWLEAWLLLYEILDQSNHAALKSGIAADPLIVDILADRFLRFVERFPESAQSG
jgi:AcrR family transcriptional regulator